MEWYRNLYTGKNIQDKKEKIIREIEAQVYRGTTYLITLAANPANELELLSVHELRFNYIRRNCPLIVGLARGRKEALELLEQIVQEVYAATGDVKIKEYIARKQ